MSVGLDKYIDDAVSLLESNLWTTYDNYYAGRSFVIDGQPKKYVNGKEYKDVFASDKYDSIIHFHVESNRPYNSTNRYHANVYVMVAVNLGKIYGNDERAVEKAHLAVNNVIKNTSFEITELVTDLQAYDVYTLSNKQQKQFNMQPFYVFRLETEIYYTLNTNCNYVEPTQEVELTIQAQTGGTTIPTPDTYTYDRNSIVPLYAVADSGYRFVQWLIDNVSDLSALTYKKVTKTMTAIAQFIAQYVITTSVSGNGTINNIDGTYDSGTQLTLTATPDEGNEFVKFTDSVEGDVLTNPYSFIANASKSIVAYFQSLWNNNLIQQLFIDNDSITEDGLYAKDYSGNDNHAPLKNSYMAQQLDGVLAEYLILKTAIPSFNNTSNFALKLVFGFASFAVNGNSASFFGRTYGKPSGARIQFTQGTGIYFVTDGNNAVTWNGITDFKTFRRWKFHFIGDGSVNIYANDTLQGNISLNWATNSYTIETLRGTRGVNSYNGAFCDAKLYQNDTLTNWWPMQSGAPIGFDVINENHANGNGWNQSTTNYKAYQSLAHYNIKYGCDVITDHAGFYFFMPRNAITGDRLTNNPPDFPLGGGTVYVSWHWNEIWTYLKPFPICETTIETLKGDINWGTFINSFDNLIFGKLITDTTYEEILIYESERNQSNINAINAHLGNDIFENYIYNKTLLSTLSDIIKYGTAKFITIGDSLSPFTYKFAEQMMFFAPQKGLGWGKLSTGNYVYNNGYADYSFMYTGTLTYNTSGATKELWGIQGDSTTVTPGTIITLDVYYHKYTQFKIYYAQNTDKGSFDIVINGNTYSVDCSGIEGLGIYTFDLPESSNDIVLNNFVGNVILYGSEINNNSGVINHMLSHGGYTSRTFNSLINPSYLADYVEQTTADFAIIMLGANDATSPISNLEYKSNILQIISDLRTNNVDLPIIFFTPTTRGLVADTPGEDLDYWDVCRGYLSVMQEICDEDTNCAIIDTGLIFPRFDDALALNYMDGVIHHTLKGQEYLSRMLYRVFMNNV